MSYLHINWFIVFFFLFHSENPREFLIEQLEQLKISQQSGIKGQSLFNNSNLDAAFGILDPANQKYITFAQYKQGEYRTWFSWAEGHTLLMKNKSPNYIKYTFIFQVFIQSLCITVKNHIYNNAQVVTYLSIHSSHVGASKLPIYHFIQQNVTSS